jgi:hypothetical protein
MQLQMFRGFVLATLFAMFTAQVPAPVPDHSMSGVVKSMDRTKLVISRPGKIPVEMTFTVNPSTQKEGVIAVGSKVQVRFRGDAHSAVATAIVVTPHAVTLKHSG